MLLTTVCTGILVPCFRALLIVLRDDLRLREQFADALGLGCSDDHVRGEIGGLENV